MHCEKTLLEIRIKTNLMDKEPKNNVPLDIARFQDFDFNPDVFVTT